MILLFVVVMVVASMGGVEGRKVRKIEGSLEYTAISCRGHSASIVEFGGVGDGKTLNTRAFQEAVNSLSQYGSDGGAQLYVPAGQWLTGSFNLTSHFTLFLHKDATLLASQVFHLFNVKHKIFNFTYKSLFIYFFEKSELKICLFDIYSHSKNTKSVLVEIVNIVRIINRTKSSRNITHITCILQLNGDQLMNIQVHIIKVTLIFRCSNLIQSYSFYQYR